jgi:predicted ATPase
MQRALDEAALQYDPTSRAVALVYTASLFMWTGDLLGAREAIDQLIAHSRRYSSEVFNITGLALKGELAVACDEVENGVDLLRQSLPFIRREYYSVATIFGRALAAGLLKIGRIDEARVTVDDGISWARDSGIKIELSELLRIKSRIIMSQDDREQAMGCLTEALEVARAQSALSFELRSTMDLARLLFEAGQRDQARQSLSLVYDRFTEGFQTADLRAARSLLERLQA